VQLLERRKTVLIDVSKRGRWGTSELGGQA